jgi:hypothetical protein
MSWRDSLLVAFIDQLVIKCLIESISTAVSSECHHSNSQAMCDPGSEYVADCVFIKDVG